LFCAGVLFQTPTALTEANRGLALFLGSITLETFRISMVILRAKRNSAIVYLEQGRLSKALASGVSGGLKLIVSPSKLLKNSGIEMQKGTSRVPFSCASTV